jgi:uncharacterized protein YgiM (DUF1202 family)
VVAPVSWNGRKGLWWIVLFLLLAALTATAPARAEKLIVADPFLEMRTGPGRGYPVFNVASRAERVEVLLRFTDWYKVRAENGREGWVHREQLERTLTDAGSQKSFRDVLVDDYLRRKLEFGASWGQFKSEPMLKVWSAYRLGDVFSVEGTIGQVQGVFSGTDFWHFNLNAEPFPDLRLSPFFGVGFGKFRNVPNASLVGVVTTNAKLADASLGVRWYITDRFVARFDATQYTAYVSERRTSEFTAVTAGLSFFFF